MGMSERLSEWVCCMKESKAKSKPGEGVYGGGGACMTFFPPFPWCFPLVLEKMYRAILYVLIFALSLVHCSSSDVKSAPTLAPCLYPT